MEPKPNSYIYAGLSRRIVAFLIDTIIASLPAFTIALVYASLVNFSAPYLYASPVIGTYTLYTLPGEVNEKLNTKIIENSVGGNTITTKKTIHNATFYATMIRTLSYVSILFYIGYSAFCTLMYDGKTVGKHLMHLCVIDSNGTNMTKPLLIREIVGKVILNSIPIVPLLSVITILVTPKHLAIHDIIGKTSVVLKM